MTMMKAARLHEWGSAEIFIDETSAPEPKSDQVLIRVRASSINPIDWKAQLGYLPHLPLPYTFGWEAAGEVAALGAGAEKSGFKVGDAVFAKTGPGGIADYVTVSTNNTALT